MNKKINILVSGCGGDIGQSIGKILYKHGDWFNIYGIDITDKTPSKFIYKNFDVGLPVTNNSFIDFISDLIKKNNIDLYIPIAEPEIRYLTEKKIDKEIAGAVIIMANYDARNIGFDKLLTSIFLENNGLPFPHTINGKQFSNQLEYPFILKSKSGSGGKSNILIENEGDLIYYQTKLDLSGYIFQEYLSGIKGEYTCGVFQGRNEEIRTIIFKRKLMGGFSSYGELIENNQINDLLIQLAKLLKLNGSINVQLRIHNNEPVIFEINPRFSSTVLFRSLFGFDDLIWSIQDKLNLPIDQYNCSNYNFFYKGFSEYVE